MVDGGRFKHRSNTARYGLATRCTVVSIISMINMGSIQAQHLGTRRAGSAQKIHSEVQY